MLEAAQRRTQLQAQLNAANADLRKAPVRESADPKAEAVAKALAFIGINAAVEEVRYALILLPAIIAELMAAFGAAMCGVQLPSLQRPVRPAESAATEGREAAEATVEPEDEEAETPSSKQKKKQLTPEQQIARFVSDHLRPGDGDVRASQVYEEFNTWWVCHAPGQPIPSQNAFGQELTKHGFNRSRRGGVSRYENVRLMPLGME